EDSSDDASSFIPLDDGVPPDYGAIEVIQCLIEHHNDVFTDANETVWRLLTELSNLLSSWSFLKRRDPVPKTVHGMEYGFGAHQYSLSGGCMKLPWFYVQAFLEPINTVFEVEAKSCPGFIYRRSLRLGTTNISHSEFHLFLENLSSKYHGDTYHLIAKNCNHIFQKNWWLQYYIWSN
ncbi:hypothetical protein Taro_040115, partial [Colocasia esculenta]|nr:hypothetical protein [Colocasia esculenta]